ncbi:hypothetical protein [Helicobacter sp. MIT 01-3238]|uniref:hypothetical protein n=1 Tax=Helicobacter sp. MIT 01-3238 TaxID=398627 RepID=UPI000E1F59C0|nr:hypothetical protein [Helicobacter sp. MIT 01-3238]RDU52430.1 hypothetical protein CQA40_07495 [Helicobacter sp. MIT 01-3238]
MTSRLVPPSLAEGVWGWVDTTSALQVKLATANKHSTSSLRASRKTCVAIHKKGKDIDCHESLRNSRNDESFHAFYDAKDTHPQTPSAREGASRSFPVNKTICHTEGVARSISKNISKDSANNAKQKKEIFCLSSI